jgi:hypothetical protein
MQACYVGGVSLTATCFIPRLPTQPRRERCLLPGVGHDTRVHFALVLAGPQARRTVRIGSQIARAKMAKPKGMCTAIALALSPMIPPM